MDALTGMDVSLGPALQIRGLGKRCNHLGQEELEVLFPIFNGDYSSCLLWELYGRYPRFLGHRVCVYFQASDICSDTSFKHLEASSWSS